MTQVKPGSHQDICHDFQFPIRKIWNFARLTALAQEAHIAFHHHFQVGLVALRCKTRCLVQDAEKMRMGFQEGEEAAETANFAVYETASLSGTFPYMLQHGLP